MGSKKTKKKTKNLSYCSPHIKVKKNDKTCFDKKALLEIANSWNITYPKNKIKINKSDNKNKLWEKISKKMNKKCSDDICWAKQNFVKSYLNNNNNNNNNNLTAKELKMYYNPERPKSWKKNPRDWLDTNNINDVMKRYEIKYDDFKFFGAVPIDFDLKDHFGKCMLSELCKIKIDKLYKKGVRKIGVIFNLDNHTQSGSHWISMFCNLNKEIIGYWDSYGFEPPNEVNQLMNKIKTQAHDMNIDCKIKINNIRHQYKGSECGVYCLNFIVEQLKNKSFEKVTKKIIKDDRMLNKRKRFFSFI